MAKKKPKESEQISDEEAEEQESQKNETEQNDIKNHSKFDKFKRGEIKLNGNE